MMPINGTSHMRLNGKVGISMDLQNYFTTGDNHYPRNRQQTFQLLEKYIKTDVAKVTQY
jgi:hypothetical protein